MIRLWLTWLVLWTTLNTGANAAANWEAMRSPAEPAPAVQLAQADVIPANAVAVAREAALELQTDEYARIQELLDRMGYELGVADGDFGARSRRALRAFQADFGRAQTGYLDDALIGLLIDTYQAAPETYEGQWVLEIHKKWLINHRDGMSGLGEVEPLATIHLTMTGGRFVQDSYFIWMWEPDDPFADFAVGLTSSGLVQVYGTVSYLERGVPGHNAPAMALLNAQIALPHRVPARARLWSEGNVINSDLQFMVSLKRR